MPRVSTYLNFARSTEQAFLFYRSVFGGEFNGGIRRYADQLPAPGARPLPESDQHLVVHIELPILGGHVLMGTDTPESMGAAITQGNNVHVMLEPDDREETNRLFEALSVNGTIVTPLREMPWGGYFGNLTDQFGIHWLFNCQAKAR